MVTQHDDLSELGWSDWFAARAACEPADTVARVAAVDRDLLVVVGPGGVSRARLAGRLRHLQIPPHELPCVGDWVCLEQRAGSDVGIVRAVIERRTTLRRRAAGEAVAYQMIAANVDTVVIVQSCHFDFNLKRLERYLVMILDGGAEPLILLTKTDLVDPEVLASQVASIRSAAITAPILTLSNVTGEGLDALKDRLSPGKTYCFVGSSGVGKSTLINQLVGHAAQETTSVSGTGEGRHKTVRRELIRLENGALVIDNPGMREFGVLAADDGIGSGYADINRIAARCRYRDCTHTSEPGCAVLQALASGEIDTAHFENYHKLRKESAFYEMSYVDKRKRDRKFGRFMKEVKKHLER